MVMMINLILVFECSSNQRAAYNYISMHALHVITLKHCHIVAMGMTLLQLRNSVINTADISWDKSTFAETPSTARHSREASIYIYI